MSTSPPNVFCTQYKCLHSSSILTCSPLNTHISTSIQCQMVHTLLFHHFPCFPNHHSHTVSPCRVPRPLLDEHTKCPWSAQPLKHTPLVLSTHSIILGISLKCPSKLRSLSLSRALIPTLPLLVLLPCLQSTKLRSVHLSKTLNEAHTIF